jgi:hypothetical protein
MLSQCMTNPRKLMLFIVAAVAVAAGGCQTRYGGKRYEVTVSTTPPGATLYFVEFEQFVKAGGAEAFNETKRPWSDWRISEVSPATVSREAILFMCVGTLKKDGNALVGWTRNPFTPGRDKSVAIPLESTK